MALIAVPVQVSQFHQQDPTAPRTQVLSRHCAECCALVYLTVERIGVTVFLGVHWCVWCAHQAYALCIEANYPLLNQHTVGGR